MTHSPRIRPVRATHTGQFVDFAPVPEGGVLGALRVGRVEAGGVNGTEFALVNRALFAAVFTPTGKIKVRVWSGLEPVCRGLLASNGVPVVDNPRPARVEPDAAPEPEPDAAPDARVTDPAVVRFLRDRERGLVRYGPGVEPLLLATHVCMAFSDAKIVIIRRREDARALAHLLARHGITAETTGGGFVPHVRQRVVVTLLGQMGLVELDGADVVLVVDALHATWTDPLTAAPLTDPNDPTVPPVRTAVGLLERLVNVATAKVFGFLPIDYPRSPFDIARSWQLYGPGELLIPTVGSIERPVQVAFLNTHVDNSVKNTIPYIGNKIRMNPARNRRLARVARALQIGDHEELVRLVPTLAAMPHVGVPQHVLLFAESLKQATALAMYLPDWPVVSGLGDDTCSLKNGATVATRGVIATALGIEALSGIEYGVVVRADAGNGLVPLPKNWRVTTDVDAGPMLLIDVRDTGHPLAALWSRQRVRGYRASGWEFVGEDANVGAWLRFRETVLKRRGST
ncbi:hypothetical protein [Gemmata sp.]|uniref:hypothetical protein n=1 Tax=Gemmata sp. TaxID=1914242 RepID=UPI003F7127CC